MQNQVTNWLRAINRGDKLNILCIPTHEAYETNLAATGHNFYAIRTQNNKNWDSRYRPMPSNYIVMDYTKGHEQIPSHIEFDLVISGDKFAQFQTLSQIAGWMRIPLISIEHTVPPPNSDEWTAQRSQMKGHRNVFITDYSITKWGFDKNDSSVKVIRHAIDSELFKPTVNFGERNNTILEVANDFINRGWCLNFQQYMRVTQGLPCTRVGDTPGFSEAAKNDKDLANYYAKSKIFINTHHVSPIPMSLLEAASAGCAIVTCNTCAIPEFFTDGKNALICNTDKDMRSALEFLLSNDTEAERLGNAARQMILEKCTLTRFISEWNQIFNEVILK